MSGGALVPIDAALAVSLSEADVRRIFEQIEAARAAMDAAIETLRELGGPDPGTFGNRLAFKLNSGAGFLRSAEADMRAAFRARNVAKGGGK